MLGQKLENFLISSWWVIAFYLISYAGYERSVSRYEEKIHRYQAELTSLREKKANQMVTIAKLQQELESQSDPTWIEMTLMKRLGMVPEGQSKIVFMSSHEH